jgi:hypothetical protein
MNYYMNWGGFCKPGVAVGKQNRPDRKCKQEGCKAMFSPRTPNHKFCDDHSAKVRLTGR